MKKFGSENNGMFTMSPLTSKPKDESFSFNEGSKSLKAAASAGSTLSTEPVPRAPFGEIQTNAFEFKPTVFAAKPTKAPFTSMMKQTEFQADNAVTPEPAGKAPVTPASVIRNKVMTSDEPAATLKAPLTVSELLLWTEPLQTLVVFVAGLMAYGMLTWVAYGAHKWSLVSSMAYLLLLDLGINFVRYFVSEPWHQRCLWVGSAQLNNLRKATDATLRSLGAAHDRYLSAVDPNITLKVAGALWALAWFGSYISLWWFVLLSYVAAFTVPGLYAMTKDQLGAIVSTIRAHTIDQVDKAGLPRTVRWLISAGIMVALIWFTKFRTALIGTFVICTYWRTLMLVGEIAAVRNFAEPYTHSVRKVSRRIGVAAEDAFQRLSTNGPATRTKSHVHAE